MFLCHIYSVAHPPLEAVLLAGLVIYFDSGILLYHKYAQVLASLPFRGMVEVDL